MVNHILVKDVLMELGEETEYYIVKSGDSEPLLRKRHTVLGLCAGSNPTPRTGNRDWRLNSRFVRTAIIKPRVLFP